MTEDTTFKEFVEEMGLNFFLLDFDSHRYRNLVEKFNEAKLKIKNEEEALEHGMTRARLVPNGQPPKAAIPGRDEGSPKGDAHFA
ncbi:MAG: hypothetical protein ABSD38_11660 [Syntrophorhabdales bacterium]|jgi:hypothetical protein